MKVLLINGSPNAKGNTALALGEMEAVFHAEGIETERIHVGNKAVRGCIGCRKCRQTGKCVFGGEDLLAIILGFGVISGIFSRFSHFLLFSFSPSRIGPRVNKSDKQWASSEKNSRSYSSSRIHPPNRGFEDFPPYSTIPLLLISRISETKQNHSLKSE